MKPRHSVRAIFALLSFLIAMPNGVLAQEPVPAATPVVDEADAPPMQTMDVGEYHVTVNVTMSDGGLIPPGLEWSVYGDGWAILDSGSVESGVTSFTATTTITFPNGSYGLQLTGGGYRVAQAITINGDDLTHTFNLTRSMVKVSFPLSTSNGGDIPAGTTWEVLNADGGSIANGTVPANLPDGFVYGPESLERGVHTLNVLAPGFQPFSTTLDLTNGWIENFQFPVDLQVLASATTFSVSMSDGEPLPNGLRWDLYPGGTWTAIASGDVTPGGIRFDGDAGSIPYGVYQLWITGNGYSYGQVLNINGPSTHHDVVLDRLIAEYTIAITTSDGRDIPAGTTFTITDSAGTLIESETLAGATSSPRSMDGQLDVDVYTLKIDAPGFHPATLEMPMNVRDRLEYDFSIELQPIVSTVSFSVSMRDGGPIPYGLQWSLDGTDFSENGDVTPGVTRFDYTLDEPVELGSYGLWITGNGYSSGQALNITGPSTHHDVVLDRITGTLSITIDTSDDGDIPAGTTWKLTDEGDNTVASGTFDEAAGDGTTLPLIDPIEFGVYTFTVSDAFGYYNYTGTINHTNPWVLDQQFTAELEAIIADVTMSVSMSDGGPIPYGLTWTLIEGDNWTSPIQTGDIPAGDTLWTFTLPEQVPAGVYQLWVAGNGYTSGQVIVVDKAEISHDFILDRLIGSLAVSIDTTDDGALPTGTSWTLTDAGDEIVASGTLADDVVDGSVLFSLDSIEFGSYELTITGAFGYYDYTGLIHVNNPWFFEYTHTATIEAILADVTISVSMSDDGPIPYGLQWVLLNGDDWENPVQAGDVPQGVTTWATVLPEQVPAGTYQLWVFGNGYASGQVIVVDRAEVSHHFTLDRLYGNLTVTLDTSDDEDIPNGTEWALIDEGGNVIDGGVLTDELASIGTRTDVGTMSFALPDGSTLPIANPIEFGLYTLEIDAPGYLPFSADLAITDPWETEYGLTAYLLAQGQPTPEPTETPAPTVTPVPSVTPAPAETPTATAEATPEPQVVTELPKTGQGAGAGMATSSLMLVSAAMAALAAAGALAYRGRQSRP